MQNGNREVVIVEAVRTPVGRGHEEKGYYKDTHPSNLLSKTYKELIDRSGVEASDVEDNISGCVQQFGEQGFNIGRNAWLEAGLPIETPATTIDRQCGSAQQAVNYAAAMIGSGAIDVAVGGGVEHMGHISFADGMQVQSEHGAAFSPELLEAYNLVPQGLSAEMIADKWEIPRSELDELAVRSHQLAAQATEEGRFEREIVPFQVNGDTYVADQGIRPDTTHREARRAEDGLQGGRQDHRRQLLADLRRRGGGAARGALARPRPSGSSRARGSWTRSASASTP